MPDPYSIGLRHQSASDFTVFCTIDKLLGQVQAHYSTSVQNMTRVASLVGMDWLE